MFLLGVVLVLSVAQEPPTRRASAILADYDGVSYPSMSEGSDPESVARFSKAIEDAAHRQEACALELFESHPGHARVPELLRMRWQLLVNVDHDGAAVRRETERFVGAATRGASSKDERLVPLAHVLRAWACVEDESLPAATRVADLERAVEVAPEDFLARVALLDFAKKKCCDPKFQGDVAERVSRLDPGPHAEGDDARRWEKMLRNVGAPWPEVAADATEPPLVLGPLRGHPIVISFFPTPWDEREKREAADLPALVREFEDDGVEYVVVHTLFTQDDRAERERHVASLGLPGRSCYERRTLAPTLLERTLGAEVPSLACLLDRDGRLVAMSCEAKSLRPALAKLGAAKAKRRPI